MYKMLIVSHGTINSNFNFAREKKNCKIFKRFKIVSFLITFKIVNLWSKSEI